MRLRGGPSGTPCGASPSKSRSRGHHGSRCDLIAPSLPGRRRPGRSSLRRVNVIAVRVQQAITDVLPGALVPGPRPEELDRVAIRLRPAPVGLEGLVQPPAQVAPPLLREVAPPLRLVPAPFPLLEADAADGIDVGGAVLAMVPHDPRPEDHGHGLPLAEPRLRGEPLQNAL